MKIYLIGMPGSGKTTLGKQVAAELNLPFVDLDHEIEAQAGKAISQIFADDGETSFRLLESQLLKEWATKADDFVMATGGGAPCFHEGIKIINDSGFSIFLDVPLEQLVKRVEKKNHRPLLRGEHSELHAKLEKLRETRLTIYRLASITLQSPTVQIVLDRIRAIRK